MLLWKDGGLVWYNGGLAIDEDLCDCVCGGGGGCGIRNCDLHPDTLYLDWHTEKTSDDSVCSTGSWALYRTEPDPCIWQSELLLAPCRGTYGTHARITLQCIEEPDLWQGRTEWFLDGNPSTDQSWGPGVTGGNPDIDSWIETAPPAWNLEPVVIGGTASYLGFQGDCGDFINCRWVWDNFRY
jgi:hypothetical protein